MGSLYGQIEAGTLSIPNGVIYRKKKTTSTFSKLPAEGKHTRSNDMDRATTLRKEMRDIIDIMPEYNLYRLRPLLDALVETDPDDLLSDEEKQLLDQCRADRKKHPETLTPWRNIRKG